jgi:hypothetical protein
MKLRLVGRDEYLHELGPERNFNESMYFNFYDPAAGLGGFVRIGNRANEGYAEMTTCLYLPDGKVGFMFSRPKIADNSAFDAGGLRFEVLEPFEELAVSYSGSLVVLAHPLEMADPRKAFADNPYEDCSIGLIYTRVSEPVGGEPDKAREAPDEEFARGHYEQLVAAAGRVSVGDLEIDVVGFGLRDHSWGPRYWQAPWYYRWLTANFGPTFGFMASRIARREGPGTRGGFVWENGRLRMCERMELTTAWEGDARYHAGLRVTLGSGDASWEASGEVMSLIPLRNRREGLVTRISEGMTKWTLSDGRTGYGLSEYLDQIVDGEPVGLAE